MMIMGIIIKIMNMIIELVRTMVSVNLKISMEKNKNKNISRKMVLKIKENNLIMIENKQVLNTIKKDIEIC